jgi:hypothetical protein
VGSVLGHKPGKYPLRYTSSNFGFQTEDVEASYLGYINSPTPYGLCLVRILLKNNGTDLKMSAVLNLAASLGPYNPPEVLQDRP